MRTDPSQSPPLATPATPPVLNYAPPQRWRPPRWLNPRMNPEFGLVLWTVASYGFGWVESRSHGWRHFIVGLSLYSILRLHRWRATLPWKLSLAIGLVLFASGAAAFLAPWAHEHWSPAYWYVYNQTYRWNYDASLRVWWAPCIGLGWVIATVAGHGVVRLFRTFREPSSPSAH
jgi:hypothetical protein